MKKLKKLIGKCVNYNLNISFTHQRINDYSIEIYKPHSKGQPPLFYTDGHIDAKKAIKKGLKFIKSYNPKN
ncbi:hypothetical protein BPT24_285 [Tenacibaculum phage pT24]|uniref:Uncharacterized protein n=1 Tax=Tenacibaculum phage pT24 TaxID=1880590 RepID=A0A1B4XX69_9CAUD|nr:hypothetical protein HYP10_gp243 [Tenacibaculum phage pT24]BAV39402.1 hypothetical protein BPT24_285 [Tenacibaculum phage pT24]